MISLARESDTLSQRPRHLSDVTSPNYGDFFAAALARLGEEQRYRVFVEIERIAGGYPFAIWQSPEGPRRVVVWCSNDSRNEPASDCCGCYARDRRRESIERTRSPAR